MTLGQARKNGVRLLQNPPDCATSFVLSPSPVLDCDCILEYATNLPRERFVSHPDDEISDTRYDFFVGCIKKRSAGLPVAYIVGQKEFFGLDFCVTPDVLIPKPDTELLVEKAASLIGSCVLSGDAENRIQVADVCTGSGCVAVAVWSALRGKGLEKRVRMRCSDISGKALAVARKNARRHGCTFSFARGDLLSPFFRLGKGFFDFVLSNPPYVPSAVARQLLSDGRGEPLLALDGDRDGTADGTGLVRRLIPQAFLMLKKGGTFLLETGEYNSAAVAAALKAAGFRRVETFHDLAGMPRVLSATKG